MFSSFIKESGERKLTKENRVNSSVHADILASHLLLQMYLGEISQQDNALAHKSAENCTWFLENGVEVLENWSPNSPDLKIIENLLKNIAKRHFKTLETWKRLLSKKIFTQLLTNMYKNFSSE